MNDLTFENIFSAIIEDPAEAADLQFRADLVITLRSMFEDRGWKQADIAKALDVPQPRVSELLRGKIHLFSADKLIGYLARMNVRLKPTFDEKHGVFCEVIEPA